MTATVLIVAALWVAVPDPRLQLRRLDTSHETPTVRGTRWVRGRQGAPALRVRVLLGALASVLVLVALPTITGVAAGLAALAVVVLGLGWLPARLAPNGTVQKELADTVELLAVCLSAGAPMRHAVEVVADVAEDATATILAKVSGQLTMGVAEPQAWLELADDDVWGGVARDVARSARSGTSLVEVLHVHADEARLVAQEQALQRARTAGVRSVVPLMACFLPAFVLVGVLPIIAGLLEGLLSP
ncbi:MAG: type II secretion system F family protein [Propionibacteriaceae bacterium]|nr:type II secretion system F family protein [Propionibacteriaceae bacterium]